MGTVRSIQLPPEVTDDLNIGVWENESGRRVPVTRIQSFQGAEHCDWTDITFLLVGPERKADWYVRDPGRRRPFSELLHTTFYERRLPSPMARPTRACAAMAVASGSTRATRRLTS